MPELLEHEVIHVNLVDYGEVGVFERIYYAGRWNYVVTYYTSEGKLSSRLRKTLTESEVLLIQKGVIL